jgi:hypothetical protein
MSDEVLSDEEYDKLIRKAVDEKVKAAMPKLDSVGRPLGMDPRPAPMMRPTKYDDAEATTGARGPIETLGGPIPGLASAQLIDKTDPAQVELADTNRRFMGLVGSQVGGAAAGTLAAGAPGIRSLLGSGSMPARILGAGATGAAAGVGSTAGSGNIEPRALATGAALGGAAGMVGAGIGEALSRAPKAATAQLFRNASDGVKGADYEQFFTSREGVVKVLKSEPDLRAALGKPEEMQQLVATKLPEAHAEATRIMDTADAKGRIPVSKVATALADAWTELQHIGGSEANPAAAAAERIGKQFSSGIGANPARPPSGEQIRQFLTQEVQPKMNPRPVTVDDKATNRASAVIAQKLKTLLTEHADSVGLGDKLAELNNRQATYIMLKDAAARSVMNEAKGGASAGGFLKDKLVKAAAGGAVGAAAGRALGGDKESTEAGSAIGMAAALGGPAVGRAAVRAAASPAVQGAATALAPVANHAAHLLVPRIVGALQTGNKRAAQQAAADAVYGGEAP